MIEVQLGLGSGLGLGLGLGTLDLGLGLDKNNGFFLEHSVEHFVFLCAWRCIVLSSCPSSDLIKSDHIQG